MDRQFVGSKKMNNFLEFYIHKFDQRVNVLSSVSTCTFTNMCGGHRDHTVDINRDMTVYIS
jgi:hypothetical protein